MGPEAGRHFGPRYLSRDTWSAGGDGDRPSARGTGIVSLLATVLSWRTVAWRHVTGTLDPSWQAGLVEGFSHHLQWGPSLIFTFGPYGLVDNILPFQRLTAFIAVAYAFAVCWALAACVVVSLRPAWSLIGAGAAAWATLAFATSKTGYADIGGALCLAIALVILRGQRRALFRSPWLFPGSLGAFSGFQLLTKFSDGLLGAGLCIVVVLFGQLPRAKAAFMIFVPMAGAVWLAWLGAGQNSANLWSYFRGSVATVFGYPSAMGTSAGRSTEDYLAATAVVVVAGVCALSLRAAVTGSSPDEAGARSPKLAIFLATAGFMWFIVKEGFVRHDTHDLTFFGLAVVAVALAQVARRHLLFQLASVALLMAFDAVAAGAVPAPLYDPGASVGAVATEAGSVLGFRGLRGPEQQLRRQLIAGGSDLPAKVLSGLKGRTVAFEPVGSALAYVYPRLRWRPEPVLQSYSAYTSYLDDLDAEFLVSENAPERVLYQPLETIDGRDPWSDPPFALETLFCHYAEVSAFGSGAASTQVLAHVAGPAGRCGEPVLLKRVSSHFGERVPVPSARGKLMTATFSFAEPLSSQVQAILLKPPAVYLEIWAAPRARPSEYRFVPGTATDPHVISVPPALAYSAPGPPPRVSALQLDGGGWLRGQGHIVVSFYAVPIEPSP